MQRSYGFMFAAKDRMCCDANIRICIYFVSNLSQMQKSDLRTTHHSAHAPDLSERLAVYISPSRGERIAF